MSASFEQVWNHQHPVFAFYNDQTETALDHGSRADLMRECMLQGGFDYRLGDEPISTSQHLYPAEPEPFSQPWVELYGYGVSTLRFGRSEVPESVITHPEMDLLREALSAPAKDEQRTPSKQAAYERRLFECHDVVDESASGYRRFVGSFADDFESLTERVESDDRLIELEAKVGRCVEQQGYDFFTPADAERAFGERLWAIETDTLNPDATRTFSESQTEDLVRLQQLEIATALAHIDCGGGLIAYEALRQEIQSELFTEYLDLNQARLIAVLRAD